ncbi:glutamate synthase-related protein [Polaribacter sp. IC063]|nr:glutamate synthase-related protein [Polaribacter sp. IC063]
MVSLSCIQARECHLDSCKVGLPHKMAI